MKKYFYQHLISEEITYSYIDDLQVTDRQKKHLKTLIDQRLHLGIMHVVLSELSEPDKKAFLNLVHMENNDLLWDFLHLKIKNAQEKIEEALLNILEELKSDTAKLKESKQ